MKKKMIIFLGIFLVVVAILIICISLGKDKGNTNDNNSTENINQDTTNFGNHDDDSKFEEQIERENLTRGKLQKIDNLTDYYILKNIVSKFTSSYYDLYNEGADRDSAEKILYNLLDKNYIEFKKLEVGNLKENLTRFDDAEVKINETYYMTEYEGVYIYFTNLYVKNIKDSSNYYTNIIFIIDKVNFTFSTFLDDYVQKYNYISLNKGDEIDFPMMSEIVKNDNNQFKPLPVSYEDYAKELYDQIKYDFVSNPERAYKLLNESQKSKYPSFSDFNNYIDKNYKDIWTSKFGSYTFSSKEDHIEYTCKDKDNKFKFVIIEKAIMEYEYYFE